MRHPLYGLLGFCTFLLPYQFGHICRSAGTHTNPAHTCSHRLHNEQKAVQENDAGIVYSIERDTYAHTCTRKIRVDQMQAHPSCSAHLRSVLPPDLPQLQHVKHGLKDPHTDGAASPGGADSPRRGRRARGRIHRGNIRSIHRWRVPTVLVAVLGA